MAMKKRARDAYTRFRAAEKICHVCYEIYAEGRWQHCMCADPEGRLPRPNSELGADWELCRCCVADVFATGGTRWGPLTCGPCGQWAKNLNTMVGEVVIPVRRHSVANQAMIGQLEKVSTTLSLEDLARELNDAIRGFMTTQRWQDHRLVENLELLGFATDQDVALADYLRTFRQAGKDDPRYTKERAFADMVGWLVRETEHERREERESRQKRKQRRKPHRRREAGKE